MYGDTYFNFKFSRGSERKLLTNASVKQEQGRSNHVERVFSLFEVLVFCLKLEKWAEKRKGRRNSFKPGAAGIKD